ncbi:MAG TPA: XrtA system polysaccharide chain length determinant, partial [Burkholderiaceae bacterium]|nr:XrtA system polysaccharide chain length determinant [Burkholderiaceae bacterium]
QQNARIEHLMKALEIKSTNRDNLYTLSYQDSDRDQAKRVVQSLVSIFVESSLGASRQDTSQAKIFLDQQIADYRAKLEAAEARLKDFRLRNLEVRGADGKDAATHLTELSAQLDQARLDLRESENSIAAAKAALANEKKARADISTQSLLQESSLSVATPEIDARIEAQKTALDALLQRFTDRHPEVIATRRVIKDLEAQKAKEVQELRRAAMAAPVSPTSVAGGSLAAQELNRVLATAEVQAAALRARVAEYAARYNQARSMMKVMPQIEAEASQLNRDYAINKKNYEDLVTRRESAAMSGSLERASGMADFRLIDPPRASPKPVAPNRLLLLLLALAAALGAGVFTAFAASQLRPVFHSGADLGKKTGLPLLGSVSLVLTDIDRRRERAGLLRFGAASASLVVLFAIGLTTLTVMAGR